MKKKLSILMTGILLTMGLSGCGTENTLPETSAEEIADTDNYIYRNAAETIEEREANAENVQLEAWVFFDENTPGTHYLDMWQELGNEFGYDVTVKAYSEEQIRDKIKIAAACGELPDFFAVWGGNYANFLFDAGACLEVSDYLDEADFQYKDSYVMPYSDGKNYIIPCLVEAYATTYTNNSLMEKMGLTMPKTWDELLTFIDQVNAYNEEHGTEYAAIEMGNKDNWLGELLYDTIVNRIDPYAFDKLQSGEIDFTNDVFGEAADKITELVDRGAFNADYMETGEVEAIQNFTNGDAVLFLHQSTILYHLMDTMGETNISAEQFPSCSAEYDADYEKYLIDINHSLTPGVCVSVNSEYADEAARLCLRFAEVVNEINVTQYGYLNMFENTDYDVPESLAAPVQQFQDSVTNAKKMTAFWYALMDQEDGDNWRNLTKKLLARAITRENFLEEGKQYF